MRYLPFVALLLCAALLNGCSPTFNWRDVRPDGAPLLALFPCKPDQGSRIVTLAAKEVPLNMLGCDAGDASFTVGYADVKDVSLVGPVLEQWKRATLGNMRAQPATEVPFILQGAAVLPQSVKVTARGSRPDGKAVDTQAVWFAVGSVVFQVAVYANTAHPAETETFFAGVKVQ